MLNAGDALWPLLSPVSLRGAMLHSGAHAQSGGRVQHGVHIELLGVIEVLHVTRLSEPGHPERQPPVTSDRPEPRQGGRVPVEHRDQPAFAASGCNNRRTCVRSASPVFTACIQTCYRRPADVTTSSPAPGMSSTI